MRDLVEVEEDSLCLGDLITDKCPDRRNVQTALVKHAILGRFLAFSIHAVSFNFQNLPYSHLYRPVGPYNSLTIEAYTHSETSGTADGRRRLKYIQAHRRYIEIRELSSEIICCGELSY
jgi:hypothetical protein